MVQPEFGGHPIAIIHHAGGGNPYRNDDRVADLLFRYTQLKSLLDMALGATLALQRQRDTDGDQGHIKKVVVCEVSQEKTPKARMAP